MMGNSRLFFYLFIGIIFIGCVKQSMTIDEYKSYYKDNRVDLKRERKLEYLAFKAEYLPAEALTLYALKDTNYDDFESKRKDFDSSIYFKFQIEAIDENVSLRKLIQNKENLSRMNSYLASEILKDFQLVVEGESVPCSIVNVESDLAIQNNIVLLMSFERPKHKSKIKEDLILIYEDNIFQNGIIKFQFDSNTINRFPKIKTA